MKDKSLSDKLGLGVFLLFCALGAAHLGRYFLLNALQPLVTMLVIEALLLLLAYTAYRARMPFLYLAHAVGCVVLYSTTNYAETTHFNSIFLFEAILAALWAVGGTLWMLKAKERPRRPPLLPPAAALLILTLFFAVWGLNVKADRARIGAAGRAIWAVPARYDTGEIEERGTVQELLYETRAYATDQRGVTKRALVYLPYGYDESRQYNILYLMHGTGDDENYWLETNPSNRVMLDRMIAAGEIEPLIVVTPTFYVEDDCRDGLDALTFSFREELRNDLMPAVESRYSTYAETADDAGFAESRDHRAFAGLSRGAVTTCHAAFCGSLDYFSWFGMFSAFRTPEAYFRETIQSEAFAALPIRYLYMTTGNFDFAMPAQVPGYRMLTGIEPRLTYGVNTSFEMFPMRYHSIGNWHLALYNYLQKIF